MISPTRALQLAVESVVNQVHTSLPGRIERYDHTRQEADIKPLLKRRYKDGQVVDMPIIPSVPIVWPRTSKACFSMPLEVGDGVLIVFIERSIDKWLNEGGNVTPDDFRKFDLSDAVAIPGLFPFPSAFKIEDNENVCLKYGDGSFKIDKSGTVSINGTNFTVEV